MGASQPGCLRALNTSGRKLAPNKGPAKTWQARTLCFSIPKLPQGRLLPSLLLSLSGTRLSLGSWVKLIRRARSRNLRFWIPAPRLKSDPWSRMGLSNWGKPIKWVVFFFRWFPSKSNQQSRGTHMPKLIISHESCHAKKSAQKPKLIISHESRCHDRTLESPGLSRSRLVFCARPRPTPRGSSEYLLVGKVSWSMTCEAGRSGFE